MTMKSHAKFEEKPTCGLENDMREICQIFTRTVESVKIGTFIGFFSPRQKMQDLKISREVMCNDTEE